jgi:hypothetical protein
MPRGDRVPEGVPRGVLACMPAGDGKPALAQRAWGTVMGVNIDDQRGPCPRARLAPHDVEHEPAIGEAVEGWNWHLGIISADKALLPEAPPQILLLRANDLRFGARSANSLFPVRDASSGRNRKAWASQRSRRPAGTSASVPLVECNHRTPRHIESGLALSLSGCIVALLLAGVIVRSPLELNQRDEWRGGKVHAADPGLYS